MRHYDVQIWYAGIWWLWTVTLLDSGSQIGHGHAVSMAQAQIDADTVIEFDMAIPF